MPSIGMSSKKYHESTLFKECGLLDRVEFWREKDSHQAGQGACTNYSLKRTKERGLRCTGSHSHGQEHGHIGWQAMWFPWFSMVHKLWKLCSKYSKPHDPKQTPYVYGAFSSPPTPTPWLWVPIYSVFLLRVPTACTVAPTNFDGPKPDTRTACQKEPVVFPFWCFAKSACRCIYNHMYIYNHVYLDIYIYIYICVCACIYIYIIMYI